ncbi:peptidoglycan DD-metalloendopeptidase family protein [Terrimonas sp. NA20]|uniref:Peptidoglycan DD-metalloendopeptidase family protein n=1 Tax=Terrimonas ginsenosidimutans TaxID=2908004 RepID=A0ABS9KXC7_9BACT|nr:peptidoglycan DD-metalloendopeptidase family protein [Terrimonas ginsenosidimutans]MCG2616892.1 peptidoglycan DD-metalloendopeptidase family protein [Terrimonas ginsenosidimutans]
MLLFACSTPQGGFSGRRLHEKYAEGIEKAGLQQTAMGAQWLAAAARSLQQPVAVTLPYKEEGYFAPEKPMAAAYRFAVQRGEKVIVKLATVPATGFSLFADLWQPRPDREPEWLAAIDTINKALEFEAKNDGHFILRVQPELLRGIEYTLTVTTAPSLAFPVRPADNPKVSSFWGAARDAGARSHEGIDIFAKFRTPVVASADGTVTRVNENNLGGKVVFLRPAGKDLSLYYAHLDTQLVTPGQSVKAGEPLGLMGNTGNARTTPPHLHFGIYASGGAIDPYPFVNVNRPAAKPVNANTDRLNSFVRSKAPANIYASPSASSSILAKPASGTIMKVAGASENWYRVLLPDGLEGYVNSTLVTTDVMRRQSLKRAERMLDQPDSTAAARLTVESGITVDVLGQFSGYYLVDYNNTRGWISVRQL